MERRLKACVENLAALAEYGVGPYPGVEQIPPTEEPS